MFFRVNFPFLCTCVTTEKSPSVKNRVICPTQCGVTLKYLSQDDHIVSIHGESARGMSYLEKYSYIVKCISCNGDMNSDFWLCPDSIHSSEYHLKCYRLCADCHGRCVELFFLLFTPVCKGLPGASKAHITTPDLFVRVFSHNTGFFLGI